MTKRGLALPTLDIADQIAAAKGADYQVLYVDAPWKFRANKNVPWDDAKGRIGRQVPYPTMTLAKLQALEVKGMVAPQAVMFFWITGPFLTIGAHIPIMKAWGFKPKAIGFTWVKLRKRAPGLFLDPKLDLHVGLGLTTRKNAEFCLIGTRGLSMRQSRKVHEVGLFPLMEHSRKPVEFRQRVEEYVGPGKKMVELFSRESGPGWDVMGNDVGRFDR